MLISKQCRSAAFVVAIGLVVLAVAAACGDDDSTAPTPTLSAITPTPAAAASPAAQSATLQISTPSGIQFDKSELDATAGQQISVTYTNQSTVSHNIDFTSGTDANAPTLAATKIATGPNDVQTITFKAPTTPGSYFFHCDVHPDQMKGQLVVR